MLKDAVAQLRVAQVTNRFILRGPPAAEQVTKNGSVYESESQGLFWVSCKWNSEEMLEEKPKTQVLEIEPGAPALWQWSDGPLSCSCNDPDEPNPPVPLIRCEKEKAPNRDPYKYHIPTIPAPDPQLVNGAIKTGIVVVIIRILVGLLVLA